MASISMKQLLEAGIHFGHQTRRWNPKMGRYIFGERHGIYIIDLQKTLRQLQKAYIVVRDTTADGGSVLFVGTKKQAQEPVKLHAERSGMFYVNNRWLGGTLTNWQTIQNSIKTLVDLEETEESGKIDQFTKKEAIQMRKQRAKLDKNLCGIKTMNGLPRVMFVVDSHRENIAVKEADRLNIPCIGICDTNSDPDAVSIPVPGNDDAIRSISLFCSIIADAAIEGRALYEKARAEEAAVKEKEADVAEEPQAEAPPVEEAPADEAPVEDVVEEAAAAVAEPASGEDTGA